MKKYDRVIIEGIELKADLAVIDKPLLIERMLDGERPAILESQLGQYDRVIDATGQRVYLPSYSARTVSTIELRAKVSSPMLPTAFLSDGGGYSWLIPLNNGEAHLGSLSPRGIDESQREIGKLQEEIDVGSTLCACQGQIWVSGPIRPFKRGNIWGLGESIGLVEPLTGIGITPAMDSARLMIENWDDALRYEREILSRYYYMVRLARIVQRLAGGHKANILDVFLSRMATRTIGIYPNVVDLIRLGRKAVKLRR
jgi:flavin-dependent dehydrogenase